MIKRHIVVSILLSSISIFTACAHTASAQSFIQCGNEYSLNSIVAPEAGSYDLYALSGQKNFSGIVEFASEDLETQGNADSCTRLGEVAIDDKNYTRIASGVQFTGKPIILYYTVASASGLQSAAPQVILSPTSSQICDLTTGCKVRYQDQSFSLSPKKLSMSSDSLRVGVLQSIEQDPIKKVVYNIDSRPTYEKSKLEPFNEGYVSGGEHTLSRTVVLKSGQSLTDTRTINRGTYADIKYVFLSLYYSQSRVIKFIGIMTSALVAWALVMTTVRAVRRRLIWKQTHIAHVGRQLDSQKTGAQQIYENESPFAEVIKYRKYLIGVIALATVFLFVTSYIIGTFTVDGVSMYPTLKDRATLPLVKIQRSWASVNKSNFIPARGTVVVINKDDNNLFDPAAASIKNYVVKRIVGLPGERITVQQGKIKVYNDEHKDGFEPDAQYKWTADLRGSEYFNIDITLKEGEMFVVGDHRDESVDSRFYGPLNVSEIVGMVLVLH